MTKACDVLRGGAPAATAAAVAFLAGAAATAGDPIGWADAATTISEGGEAAGVALTIVGVIATGAVLWFGLTSMLAVTLPMTLGGAIMANGGEVADAIFGAAAAGGSVSGYEAVLDAAPSTGPFALEQFAPSCLAQRRA